MSVLVPGHRRFTGSAIRPDANPSVCHEGIGVVVDHGDAARSERHLVRTSVLPDVGALFAGSVPNFLQDLKIGAKNDVSRQCFIIPASAVEVWEATKTAVKAIATRSVRFMAVGLLSVGYNHPLPSVGWDAGGVRRVDGNIRCPRITRQRVNVRSATLN